MRISGLLAMGALNLLFIRMDFNYDRHMMMLSTGDVMVDLFADDSLSNKPEAELVDECLYSTLLLRGGQQME